MPARSVALERFTKYSDAGRQFLTSAEYAQMTGRAGRRGLDDEGHAIVCFASDLSLHDVGRVALAPPADLHSSFRPTYNFTANLINHFDYETALDVVQRSFAQFENDRRPAGTKRPLTDQMIARHHVLEELGYAEGWTSNANGQLLRSILPRVRSAHRRVDQRGCLRGLEPAELAGLLSCFVYESKRSTGASTAGQPRDRPRRSVSTTIGSARCAARVISERFQEIAP